MYGLAISKQDSFGGGVFRGRNAPRDSLYDAVNGLVNDERELFKRGGDALLSTADFAALGLAVAWTVAGQRVMLWSATVFAALNGTVPQAVLTAAGSDLPPRPNVRATAAGDYVLFPALDGPQPGTRMMAYAGSRKTGLWSTGSPVTVTQGSTIVTWAGGGFLANVDVGMILRGDYGADGMVYGVVQSVDSDTSLTLTREWAGATTGVGGTGVVPATDFVPWVYAELFGASFAGGFVGSAGYRALIGGGNVVAFSEPFSPLALSRDNRHELPADQVITGLEGLGSTAVVFTTSGVWAIANLDLDPLDGQGNIQHTVQQLSQDVILWGDAGIAAWAGAMIVPAVDDVMLFALGAAPVPLSAAIRPLYRGYVKAGYQPGVASVHRGHYFLPIFDGAGAKVDALVCRLDLRDSRGNVAPAWTRLAGHAAGAAFAVQVGASARQPKLLAVTGQRVSDLSGIFSVPGAATDADGSVPAFTVVTQDLPTGGGPRGQLCKKLRVRYEMAGAGAAVSAEVARGAEGAAFTALTVPGAAPVSDGTVPATWKVAARAPALRFRLSSASATTKLILRGVEMHVRPSGKA